MNFAPLHVHDMWSLLDGLSKPTQNAKRCAELGYTSCAITNHGSVSSYVQHIKACNKEKIKPILGCEFYLSAQDCKIRDQSNRKLSHLVVLAKNLMGWKNLIKAVSLSNTKEIYYYRPRLDLQTLSQFCDGNLIAFSGHIGSDLANCIFSDPRIGYNAKTIDEAQKYLDPDCEQRVLRLAERYQHIFGKGNFFIEIQAIDEVNLPSMKLVNKILRELSIKTGIPKVATPDSHYSSKEDAVDQRILLCSAFETTLQNVRNKISAGEDVTLSGFFKSNNYHIPSLDEIKAANEEDEIANSLVIADMCESFNVLSSPKIPNFPISENISQHEYLTELCRKGWVKKIDSKMKRTEQTDYISRIKDELKIIKEANLAGYFNIVQDYVNWAKDQKWLMSPGRGSGMGCLISYLINITSADPVPYGLLFSRFYNAGRNKPGHISLPDIDCDFPTSKLPLVIDYIKNKYGHDKVCKIATFSSMQGRGAIKDVLRAHGKDFNEMNRITNSIPQNDKIADQLQVMLDARGESSSIRWTLENDPKSLSEWCHLDDNDQLQGPYSVYFAQAMRLEGVKRNMSRHASGLVISVDVLSEVAPMVRDEGEDNLMLGLEMEDAEAIGLPKFDILGVRLLDKLMGVQCLLKNGSL